MDYGISEASIENGEKKVIRVLKELLKKNDLIVKIYEFFVGGGKEIYRKIKRRYLWSKLKVSYGEKNSHKVFLVIPPWDACGLYSNILVSLPYIELAEKKGYIPVFDYLEKPAPLIQDEEKWALENSFEYYYEQPQGTSLDEVYQSRHVIKILPGKEYLAPIKDIPLKDMFPAKPEELLYWHNILVKNFRLQKSLIEQIEKAEQKFPPKNGKTLGVEVRAIFRWYEPKVKEYPYLAGHPKVPNCKTVIEIVEQKMKEWGCEYVFFTADEKGYIEQVKEYFGNRCLYVDRTLPRYFTNDEPVEIIENPKISVRKIQEEYIKETYLLSKCSSLFRFSGGGAQFAHFLNGGKYEHIEEYNEGYITIT